MSPTIQPKVKADVCMKVVGYARPVANWNNGKKQEWRDRKLLFSTNK